MKRLSTEVKQWSREIQTAFYEEYPFFSNYPLAIDLIKKDSKRGYAFGKIMLKKDFEVPVVIEEFILKDFDVAMVNGDIVPFTRESVLELMNNSSAFKGLDDRDRRSKTERLFSPGLLYPIDRNSGFNYGYKKEAAQLIPSNITKEGQERLLNAFTRQDMASFVCNKTAETLEALLTAEPAEEEDLAKIASDALPRDRQYIHKTGRDEYTLYSGNAEVDDAIIMKINGSEKESLNMKFAKARTLEPEKEPKLTAKIAKLSKGDEGVISDGETHIKIAVTDDLTYDGVRSIEGLDGFNHVQIKVTHVPKITKTAENQYMVPRDFKFYELGLEEGVKVAVDKTNNVYKDGYNRYTFQGPVFSKYASNNHNILELPEMEAKWVAIQCGACEEDVEKMAHSNKWTRYNFPESNLKCPVTMEDFVEKWAMIKEADLLDADPIINELPSLFKIATQIDETRIVDSILSLGVINGKNMREFTERVAEFENVSGHLAKLLLQTKLGERSVPERDVQEAMESLTKVTMHLKNAKNTAKNSKELV